MKKIISFFAFLIVSIVTIQAQISVPSTYSYTQKIFGEEDIEEIKSYFLFTGGTTVIWCLESHDNFIYPIGFGTYNKAKQTLTFSSTNSLNKKIAIYRGDNPTIVFKLKTQNGNLQLSTNNNNEDLNIFFGDIKNGILLSKEKYVLKPNNKLVGKGYKYEDDDESFALFFKSATEVIIDGATRGYVSIGNTIGIISGDNPAHECVVGKIQGDELVIHRSGFVVREYPPITLTLQD